MSSLHSPDIVGPLYYWMGQIVDESNWIGNINPKIHERDDVPGFSFRYKVRIFGRDTKSKENVPDSKLDWADVVLPVTAGSGHGGSVQTPNLRQGAYVMGYYLDSVAATRPVIMFAFPNDSQTRLFGGDPRENFEPRSGFYGKTGTKPVSTKNILTTGPGSTATGESSGNPANIAQKDQQKDGSRCFYVPKTKACEGPSGELRGIQRGIKNLINLINDIKGAAKSFIAAASDLTSTIRSAVNDATLFISTLVKSLIGKIRGYIINKINAGLKDLYDKLPPNLRALANDSAKKSTDTLGCVFNKIIAGLKKLIKKLLEQIIDKYINAPMCAIENFIGTILSNILGEITSGIESALSFIEGVLGKVGNIAGKIFEAFDIALGVLKFLSCDEELDCSPYDQWSFWGGTKCTLENVRTGIGSFFQGAIAGLGGTTGFGSITAPPCNTSAIPCGPPTLSIAGGGGSGVLGNPIISATGSILGIDFLSGGSNFDSKPTINIIDNCGIGGGAVIVPIMSSKNLNQSLDFGNKQPPILQINVELGSTALIDLIADEEDEEEDRFPFLDDEEDENEQLEEEEEDQLVLGETPITVEETPEGSRVIGAVVLDEGAGYLSAPNGDLGGNGTVWADKEQTAVQRSDGTFDTPYNPGEVITVRPGDTVQLPGGPPNEVQEEESFTAPPYNESDSQRGQFPSSSSGTYPVILSIGAVVITNPGISYRDTDEIQIVPDNGAELIPKYDEQGRLSDVFVAKSGIGFTEFPRIFIQSTQGANAQIRPIFKIERIGNLSESRDRIPKNASVVNVVDCVGKIGN